LDSELESGVHLPDVPLKNPPDFSSSPTSPNFQTFPRISTPNRSCGIFRSFQTGGPDMALAPLAVAVLVSITPYGMIPEQKMSEAMPAITCEKTLSHPAVRETYDNMTDLKGRKMMLICMPVHY
jgi:hypothetical protein